ncbi:MAG: hypothetical protein Kow0029_02530 [Candidatus Rifleibacteriota bacterium]
MHTYKGGKSIWLLAFLLMLGFAATAYAGQFKLVYEQVVKDSYGNEIGYRTVSLSSPNDLPMGSPWRDYLNQRMPDGKTIYEYARDISPYLSRDFNLTISDRQSVSYSSKSYSSYNLNLFAYVTRFSNDEFKTFLFLHEFGHVAMLNAYPSSYDFIGLDYGSDNKHYIDEILPNANTAWVEGWANGFAADRNNGKVFSFDMNSSYALAFLQNNSFDEMTRNELFVAKNLYDVIRKIDSGKTKAFNVISRTGPHYSIREFCRGFTALYPNDKAALAKILVDNSNGKMTLNDVLDYVNGGSRTVPRDLYNYLVSAGLVKSTTTGSNQTASNQTNSSGSSYGSWWSRFFGWFSGLFRKKNDTPVAAAPAASVEVSAGYDDYQVDIPGNGATSPQVPISSSPDYLAGVDDLAKAQEIYYQAFSDYNRLLGTKGPGNHEVKEALAKMQQAKAKIKELKKRMR